MKLETKIKNGKSIMVIEPHPDDEVFIPGIFDLAKKNGCKSWVVCVGCVENIPAYINKWTNTTR